MTEILAILTCATPALAAILLALPWSAARTDRLNLISAVLVVLCPAILAAVSLSDLTDPVRGRWYLVDPAGAVLLLVVAVVGAMSAGVSLTYLTGERDGFFQSHRARRSYYTAFYVFWGALLAVVLVDNLAVAWVLIEVTTAASALLVAFSGTPRALEAGWKYLALSTLGLSVTLLGIIVLYTGIDDTRSLSTLDWGTLKTLSSTVDHSTALLGLILILAGLAAKIGWAPVHSWGIDAHSEAPAPICAMLSAALSPAVMLIAWRTQTALQDPTGGTASALFLAFGLMSLGVAVPFLWQRLPIKRLLAYSSLEHMGILAIGIGFASPLATAGVVLHLAGHALAKPLGFYAAIPVLREDPRLAIRAPRDLGARAPVAGGALALSLLALSGLPPSPLFFSELLILLGGLAAGQTAVVAIATVLLALGFLGLTHALIEGILTDKTISTRRTITTGPRLIVLLGTVTVGLIVLSGTAFLLPDSELVRSLMGGIQ